MSSAVQALISDQNGSPSHEGGSRYRAWCVCCEPEAMATEGKPQRSSRAKQVLAWRTRLEAQQTLVGGQDDI
jgi:hypothetical protein